MSVLADLHARLTAGAELSPTDIAAAVPALTAAEVPAGDKENFLAALARKGETAGEIAAFAKEFRVLSLNPGVARFAPRAIDIVGTGGDHAGGFNVSSLVVLTLASLGVPVMKHGNRGITSKCGSADLLAALGVKIDAPVEKTRASLEQLGFCFFFAPAYHPAFKEIAPVRKALAARGQRTVFNLLGPLINPGRPAHLLLGVFAEPWVTRLAQVLELLGAPAALAAHGMLGEGRGIDELTTTSPNRVRGVGRLRDLDGLWNAPDFGLPVSPFADIAGGDVATNHAIVGALLAGRGPAGLADTIVLNTAVALWIVGRVPDVRAGLPLAREHLLGGAVQRKISDTRDFFAA